MGLTGRKPKKPQKGALQPTFTTTAQVGFGDVDAAAIVFYPRYFVFLNTAIEQWFAQKLRVPFATFHIERKLGVPTVHLDVDFRSPFRLGDTVDIKLAITKVGSSSVALEFGFFSGSTLRLSGKVVLVCMSLASGKAVSWPADVKARMKVSTVPWVASKPARA